MVCPSAMITLVSYFYKQNKFWRLKGSLTLVGMFLKRARTLNGFRMSWALLIMGSSSRLYCLAIENDSTCSLIISVFLTTLSLSCMIFNTPHFLTTPNHQDNEKWISLSKKVEIFQKALLTISFAAVEADVVLLGSLMDPLTHSFLLQI